MTATEPLNVGQVLSAQARLQPNRIGARDLDRAMSFRQWNERACRLANALTEMGLATGDRVAILAYNRVEWVEIFAAAAKSGIVAVPVNFRLTGPEAQYIAENSGVRALIVEDVLAGTIAAVRDKLDIAADRFVLIGNGNADGEWQAYEDLIGRARADEPAVDVSPDDPWCLMYTSGTTGRPKGAIRTHRGIAMLALMTAVELAIRRADNALLVMPMCHANSLFFFAAFVYSGASVTIFSKASFDPGLCLRTMGEYGITFTSLVPTHYTMMLDVPMHERGTASFDRVEKLMISSAPARADTKRAVMDMFPNTGLFELYGSTEGGWVTMLHPNEQFDKLGSVGRETIGSAAIKLMDDDGNEVPDGQPGELYSCSPYSFTGYWNNPDKTAEAFRGTYMTVGDIAIRDEDGFIKLIDRKNNVIITGGENVYPSEVEAVIGSHPAVADAAVIGLPDDKWGERVTAAVVRRAGKAIDETVLTDWCREKLAGYKRPRSIVFIEPERMPRNATGKILHRLLREQLS
ncbi:MAG: AMP-binding protein [Anderseniella sp.]|jgi:acyl-CoA synthetase (AMP-forming)/AMP-acid ligase II|nr:AMP-binding protein [Anderseniella sp.]